MTVNISGSRRNTVFAVLGVIVLVGAFLLAFGTGKAGATGGGDDEPCVPRDAYTETVVITPAVPAVPGTPAIPPVTKDVTTLQHYSWTGGRRAVDNPPTEVPPSVNWQANTTKEPHKSATWVNESLHYTANSKGFASWFYLGKTTVTVVITPGVPATPGTPEIPAVTEEVFHEAVVCETPTETPSTPTETPTTTPPVPTETPSTIPVTPSETPTVTPEVPTETETPEPEDENNNTPNSIPKPPKPPKDVQLTECVNGVFVTSINGEVIAESGSCDESSSNTTRQSSTPVVAQEEGL